MISPEVATIIGRFVLDGAAVFLWGTSAYLTAAVPEQLAQSLAARLMPYQRTAAAFLVLALLLLLPAETAVIGDGWASLDVPMLLDVLGATSIGYAWAGAAISGILLFVAACLPARIRQPLFAMLCALLLVSLAMTGHVAMQSGWLGVAHRTNHVLHVLAGGAWLGALIPVLMILARLPDTEARQALTRFSTLGHGAVALVILTGAANTYLIVGGLPADWSFQYQILLSAKIVLVLAMTALAVINRYVLVPRMRAGRQSTSALTWLTVAEIALGAAILGLVAWFGTLEPR